MPPRTRVPQPRGRAIAGVIESLLHRVINGQCARGCGRLWHAQDGAHGKSSRYGEPGADLTCARLVRAWPVDAVASRLLLPSPKAWPGPPPAGAAASLTGRTPRA